METESLDNQYFARADKVVDKYRRVSASLKGSGGGFGQESFELQKSVRSIEQGVDGSVQTVRTLIAGLHYLIEEGYYADLEEAVARLDFQKSLGVGNPAAIDKELDILIEAGELDDFQVRVAEYCSGADLDYYTFFHFTDSKVKTIIQEEFTVRDYI